MDFISSLTTAGVSTGPKMVELAWEIFEESDEEVQPEELVTIGILKNYGDIFPEVSDYEAPLNAYVEDYETLRLAGLPGKKAKEITHFIYAPRHYLTNSGLVNGEFAHELSEEQIEAIVKNALMAYLDSLDISKSELVFDVAALEKMMASEVIDLE